MDALRLKSIRYLINLQYRTQLLFLKRIEKSLKQQWHSHNTVFLLVKKQKKTARTLEIPFSWNPVNRDGYNNAMI